VDCQLSLSVAELEFIRVSKIRRPIRTGLPGAAENVLVDPMQQPHLPEIRIGADHSVEHQQNIGGRNVEQFAREALEFGRRVRVGGVPRRAVIRAWAVIHDTHAAQVLQIEVALPIVHAAHGIPETRRIHALAAVIGGTHDIVRPEKFLALVIYQDGIVGHRPPVVVEVVRALGIGVVRSAVDSPGDGWRSDFATNVDAWKNMGRNQIQSRWNPASNRPASPSD
jgi:hypothetical protein